MATPLFGFNCPDVDEQYRLLGFVKGMLIIMAWVFLVLFLIFTFIILLFGGGPDSHRIVSLFSLFMGIVYFLVSYSVAGLLEIGVNIQANTKKTTILLGGRQDAK
ncbi:MAG: hypothetical protein GF384_02785 [Elusimicrobia bacterium]|nr:hypothetical protein [Elusimicrobiota bacterium]MBD3411882.1 hypothetical protein [Elusimicrobiota bacterium]